MFEKMFPKHLAPKFRKPKSHGFQRVLIVPDTHAPYHHRYNFELVLAVAKEIKIDSIIILGDFGDFYCVADHLLDPNRPDTIEWEMEGVNLCLDRLDDLGAKKKIYLQGNHENRLERYLAKKAPELFNTVKYEKLLKLKERGWDYHKYKHHIAIGKLNATHDCGNAGQNAVLQALAKFQDNIMIGHTHRFGCVIKGNAKGDLHFAGNCGWLGDPKYIDYEHRINVLINSIPGFSLGYLEDSGVIHIDMIPIIKGRCRVEGKIYGL